MTAEDLREPEIALVLSADVWVDDLHRYCTDHGGARVRCMVLDPAVALDEDFDVLVTSDRWPALTRPFVELLGHRGRRVLVVGDPARADDLVERLGVDAVVAVGTTPPEVVAAVVALVPRPTPGPESGSRALHPRPAEVGPGTRPRCGSFMAVGGPSGAGSTEVAIALAAIAVRKGQSAVLVDADQVTPSVAVRLGLPVEPNLCTAVDAVVFGLGAVPGTLFDLGDGWPVVLVGPPHRGAGEALTASDVVAVGEVLAERFSPVVFDVSAGGGPAPDRTDVRAAIVGRAAVVVAVGAANPVGVVRLVEWMDGLHGISDASIHVVANRAPSGRARRAELAGELQRDPRVAGLTFVPVDPRVEDAAWTASIVDRGPFARAMESVHRGVAERSVVTDRRPASERGAGVG